MEPRFFNPWGNLRITRHNLPHWQQAGASIFVTFRLADSLPVKLLAELADERAAWLKARETPLSPADEAIYHRLFSTKLDAWLDAGHGDCLLRDAQAQAVLRETLEHFDGVRYQLIAWVIMPNHVHVCFSLYEGWSLERVMFTWKRRSAGELNRLTGRKGWSGSAITLIAWCGTRSISGRFSGTLRAIRSGQNCGKVNLHFGCEGMFKS
ncbi:MAG: hypothetical protein RL376_1193 [Verrucomicrobiota bacterium]|jgi:REP element-mobilizing transposase RayT